ncbi:macrolide 2'-phosphotransferase [Oculatella sp. LEGE 06141]|uniref:macrolide 2'-phosphotransferase n=1 Tax=Oculatella sp. LEGE 06141 TaxID=1828648 RepID=UPI0018827063|nr:macrolide 2'-phosphotransferase [Oculatella sp. LEGE 06141]MBE9180295.1 macrolide 2'-phosphotransferase [Oculatella sp. LEGE 06141]
MKRDDILNLAASYGLQLNDDLVFNEMGIDFKVAFVTDINGKKWVLRIPRRDNLASQIEQEKKILALARKYLSISVPDWKIASPKLVAYPLLENKPVITFDPETYGITWNIDQKNTRIVSSLAKVLVELHHIPTQEAASIGVKSLTPQMARQEILHNIESVKREIGISAELETRWRRWVDTDSLWPTFSTFIHGDLYAGHILADKNGEVSGIIDWSEGQVGDPSIDLSGHIAVFGEQSLRDLIDWYKKFGGRVWENIFAHSVERYSATPLNYAIFAIKTNMDEHITAAKGQLGLL